MVIRDGDIFRTKYVGTKRQGKILYWKDPIRIFKW